MAEPTVYLEKLSAFARILRMEGLPVSPRDTEDGAAILTQLGFADRGDGENRPDDHLCKSREEQLKFSAAFDGFFLSEEAVPGPGPGAGGAGAAAAGPAAAGPGGAGADCRPCKAQRQGAAGLPGAPRGGPAEAEGLPEPLQGQCGPQPPALQRIHSLRVCQDHDGAADASGKCRGRGRRA